jgi:hypothetical protein
LALDGGSWPALRLGHTSLQHLPPSSKGRSSFPWTSSPSSY